MTPLMQAVSRLGAGAYKDGSSTKPGWLYQPMGDWFPELQGVPVHSAAAVRHTFEVIKNAGGHKGTLLDYGCSTGYYLAGLKPLGYAKVLGFEKDSAAADVAKLLGFHAEDMACLTARFFSGEFGDFRPITSIALNVHMWWEKQRIAEDMMRVIEEVSERLFFQTAGYHSRGRYVVPEFKTLDDEHEYLSRWWPNVQHLDTTTLHGGVRHLWMCSK